MLICNSLQEAKMNNRKIIVVKETGDICNINGFTELKTEYLSLAGFFSTKQEVCDYLKTLSESIQDEKYERVSYVGFLVEEFDSLENFHNVGDIIVEFISYDETNVDLTYYTTAYKSMLDRSKQRLEEWLNE